MSPDSSIDFATNVFMFFLDYHKDYIKDLKFTSGTKCMDGRKSVQVKPHLKSLHWLDVNFITEFQIWLLVFNYVNNLATSYLSNLLHPNNCFTSLISEEQKHLSFKNTAKESRGQACSGWSVVLNYGRLLFIGF